ncbi:hypothetical protein C0995_009746 [Termitomyces sp. Mi166|nr:hypothetical protein C0995_009746 [Termitomyces sp. Mi166\
MKDEYTVADLRNEEVVKQITTISTFYIPPRGLPLVDKEMEKKLFSESSDPDLEQKVTFLHAYPRLKWISPGSPTPPAYGPVENIAVSRLANYTIPGDKLFLRGSQALRQFMVDLALQPVLRKRYEEDPASVVDALPGVTPEEKFALTLHHPAAVIRVMQGTREAITNKEVLTREEIAQGLARGPGMEGLIFVLLAVDTLFVLETWLHRLQAKE